VISSDSSAVHITQLAQENSSARNRIAMTLASDGLTKSSRSQTTQEMLVTNLSMTMPAAEHRAELSSKALARHPFHNMENALKEMSECNLPFLGRYQVLGPHGRRSGGQGVVQFMQRKHAAGHLTAKFTAKVCCCKCQSKCVWCLKVLRCIENDISAWCGEVGDC
jgi:hypothetical protein